MIHEFPFHKSTRQVCGTAVSIYMIGTILCIIFQDKNRRLVPDGRICKMLNE